MNDRDDCSTGWLEVVMNADNGPERNLKAAKRWFEELWGGPDLDLADEIVDDSYAPDWIQIPKTGPAQVKHEIRYFRSALPDLTYEVLEATADGDKVWVRYRGRGTQLGPAWGFEASGKTATFEGVTIFTFNADGRIVDRWGAFCFYDLFVELGHVRPWWELGAGD
jgi:hypothetical protein